MWGSEVHGIAPSRLKQIRADATKAVSKGVAGTCATTALRLLIGAKADPWVAARIRLVRAWIKTITGDTSLRHKVEKAWERAKTKASGKDRWKRTKGPITAIISTLRDMETNQATTLAQP